MDEIGQRSVFFFFVFWTLIRKDMQDFMYATGVNTCSRPQSALGHPRFIKRKRVPRNWAFIQVVY